MRLVVGFSVFLLSIISVPLGILNSAPSRAMSFEERRNLEVRLELGVEKSIGLISGRDCEDLGDNYKVALFPGDKVSLEFLVTEEKFSLVAWEARLVDRSSHRSILIDQDHLRGSLLEGLHALKTRLGSQSCEDCEIRLTLLGNSQVRQDFCHPVSVVKLTSR